VIIERNFVRFRLSPEGEIALKGIIDTPSLKAFVEAVDDLGAWVLLDAAGEAVPMLLLKWDYFATAVVDFKPAPQPKPKVAGFVNVRSRKGRKTRGARNYGEREI
jgi:hypothetical protein